MNKELLENGYIVLDFPYHQEFLPYVIGEKYFELDQFLLKEFRSDGRFFKFFFSYFPVEFMEHIIALRQAPDDEDGIWHDDGSRLFGFSLSLNLKPDQILGGNLLFKQKNNEDTKVFPPQPFGRLIIFLTGQFGYDHKVTMVESGKRLVIAGWGSKANNTHNLK